MREDTFVLNLALIGDDTVRKIVRIKILGLISKLVNGNTIMHSVNWLADPLLQ